MFGWLVAGLVGVFDHGLRDCWAGWVSGLLSVLTIDDKILVGQRFWLIAGLVGVFDHGLRGFELGLGFWLIAVSVLGRTMDNPGYYLKNYEFWSYVVNVF